MEVYRRIEVSKRKSRYSRLENRLRAGNKRRAWKIGLLKYNLEISIGSGKKSKN